jgi:hypothetical protein
MSLHKLTAGSGYDYLTRQVAALDATDKGHIGLASYYTEPDQCDGIQVADQPDCDPRRPADRDPPPAQFPGPASAANETRSTKRSSSGSASRRGCGSVPVWRVSTVWSSAIR